MTDVPASGRVLAAAPGTQAVTLHGRDTLLDSTHTPSLSVTAGDLPGPCAAQDLATGRDTVPVTACEPVPVPGAGEASRLLWPWPGPATYWLRSSHGPPLWTGPWCPVGTWCSQLPSFGPGRRPRPCGVHGAGPQGSAAGWLHERRG